MKFSIFNFQFSISLFVSLIFLLVLPFSVEAIYKCGEEPLVPCGSGTAEPVCKLCHFFELFKNIINFVLWCIVPPLAALFIAIAGFYLFFTEGKPENVTKGKDIIKTTLIGLVIIFAAWLIVNLFFQFIGVAEWTGLSPDIKGWWKIPCD